MSVTSNEIGQELHRRDHERGNHFMWGRDYGKDVLVDLNMLAHAKGTDPLTRDTMQRAYKEIIRLRNRVDGQEVACGDGG